MSMIALMSREQKLEDDFGPKGCCQDFFAFERCLGYCVALGPNAILVGQKMTRENSSVLIAFVGLCFG